VTTRDARNAIDALLAHQPVPVSKTPAVGCSTKWAYKAQDRRRALAKIENEPITVTPAGVDDLKILRKNPTGKLLLVNFWATWCGPCLEDLPELETMYRMYRHRPFDLVTVSINYPDEKQGVLSVLQKQHATNQNLLFGSTDTYALMASFDQNWTGAVPYTMLIGPDGEVVYKCQGSIDPLDVRRLIIANLPDDSYKGHQAYWKTKP
jgi:thiol-disulfide isomerase/thioredoxin